MAERFPTEGLDKLLAILTGNNSAPANLWVGYFTSQSASTVPAANAVLATQTGVTEAAYLGYAREQIDPADWASPVGLPSGTGRRRIAAQQSLPTASAGASQETSHGFFIATAVTGGIALFYSNFDEGDAVIGEGDTPRITPWIGLGE